MEIRCAVYKHSLSAPHRHEGRQGQVQQVGTRIRRSPCNCMLPAVVAAQFRRVPVQHAAARQSVLQATAAPHLGSLPRRLGRPYGAARHPRRTINSGIGSRSRLRSVHSCKGGAHRLCLLPTAWLAAVTSSTAGAFESFPQVSSCVAATRPSSTAELEDTCAPAPARLQALTAWNYVPGCTLSECTQ